MTTPRGDRRAGVLSGLWLVTGVLVFLPALLLLSAAEDAAARRAAVLLLLTAGVALACAGLTRRATRRTLQISLAGSALVAVAGGSAIAELTSKGSVGPIGGLMFGGLAVVGGTAAALVAGARWHRVTGPTRG